MASSSKIFKNLVVTTDTATETTQRGALSSDDVEIGGMDLFGPLTSADIHGTAVDGSETNVHSSPDECPEHLLQIDSLASFANSGKFDRSQVLDKSWQQLEPKPVEFFWESGFWAEIFENGDSGHSSSSMVRHFDLHRPPVVREPVGEVLTDEGHWFST